MKLFKKFYRTLIYWKTREKSLEKQWIDELKHDPRFEKLLQVKQNKQLNRTTTWATVKNSRLGKCHYIDN